jgi:cation:H+ antiporter
VFSGLGFGPLVLIFLAAAGAIWLAGIHLSSATDALDIRLGLGEAIGGVILLALATNLPEIAIMLAIVVMGAQLPATHLLGRIEPASLMLAIFWVVGVFLISRARRGLPWHDTTGTAPGGQAKPRGHSKTGSVEKMALGRAGSVFAVGAAVTLGAGIVLEQSGEI